MHESVMEWVGERAGRLKGPCLEVGSHDINGSVRKLCPLPYVGVDIVPGEGVDEVYDGRVLPFGSATFGTVICTEVFEHAADPVGLAFEIVRVLEDNGCALITARGPGFPLHDQPDRWRFMPGALSELFSRHGCHAIEEADPQTPGRFVEVHKVPPPKPRPLG